MASQPRYVLGAGEAEIARLDAQAAGLAPATGLLLREAGIADGMRVLDLGDTAAVRRGRLGPEAVALS